MDHLFSGSNLLGELVSIGILKAGLLLAFAGLVVVLLRRSSAAVRCNIWCVSIGLLLLLPLFSLSLPAWHLVPAKPEPALSHRAGDLQPA